MPPRRGGRRRLDRVRSPCLGMCEQAPAVFAQRAGRPEVALGDATRATIDAMVAPDSTVVCAGGVGAPQTSAPEGRDRLRLLRRAGVVDPDSIDDYRATAATRRSAPRSRWEPRT